MTKNARKIAIQNAKVNKVLLFSGGLDSFCYSYLCTPDILLYLDNGSKYSKIEIENIKQLAETSNLSEKLKIVRTKDMGYLEQQNAIIENRNLFFILEGAFWGEEIILGATAGDGSKDKDTIFFDLLSRTISYSMGKPMKVHAPFIHLTKAEIIAAYINDGGNVEYLKNVYSCYQGHPVQCGKCKPCVRNAIAFRINKIGTKDIYAFDIFQNEKTKVEYCKKVCFSSLGTKRNREGKEIERFLCEEL